MKTGAPIRPALVNSQCRRRKRTLTTKRTRALDACPAIRLCVMPCACTNSLFEKQTVVQWTSSTDNEHKQQQRAHEIPLIASVRKRVPCELLVLCLTACRGRLACGYCWEGEGGRAEEGGGGGRIKATGEEGASCWGNRVDAELS